MVVWFIFSSILQIWYVEVRISWSISESPLDFEITRFDCTRKFPTPNQLLASLTNLTFRDRLYFMNDLAHVWCPWAMAVTNRQPQWVLSSQQAFVTSLIWFFFSIQLFIKGKRKVQAVPQSQTAAPPRPQEEEETDKSKQAQTEQTYEKHQD